MILTEKIVSEFVMVLFCIFMICIAVSTLVAVASLLVGFVLGIICNVSYAQIGPTCGFYALVYAVGKVKDIDLKQEVRRIIKSSINEEKSYVGEIFKINKLSEIAEKYFPDIDASIKAFNSVEELDELVKDYYLIYPVLRRTKRWKMGDTPHYYFIEAIEGEEYLYRTGRFGKNKYMEKSKMLEENTNLKKLDYFCWNCYYKKKRPFFAILAYYIADWSLYSFLNKQYKDKKKVLLNQYSKINMAGKVLAIKKVQ